MASLQACRLDPFKGYEYKNFLMHFSKGYVQYSRTRAREAGLFRLCSFPEKRRKAFKSFGKVTGNFPERLSKVHATHDATVPL